MPAHARAPPLATAAPTPVPGTGSGSLPGLVLFEPGLTGMGYGVPAIRIRTAPPTVVCKRLRRLKRTVATVRSELLRTVATVGWVRTILPLSEHYK